MNIIFASMHHIDLPRKKVIPTILNNDDVKEYINDLANEAIDNRNKKFFRLVSETKEVVGTVKRIFDKKELPEKDKDIIANRLLESELDRQDKIDKLGVEIKKGSLVQSLLQNDNEYYFLIVKIESNKFLDTDELLKREGLLFENKALKTCVFRISEEGEFEEILLSDSNPRIAEYWYSSFLEVKELTDDETNTKRAYSVINNELKKYLEKKHPQDYILCQNIAKTYFQVKNTFRKEDFLDYLFDEYIPQDPNMDTLAAKGKLFRAYDRKMDDTEFSIETSAIKFSSSKVVKKVNSFVELSLVGIEAQIKNNISSVDEGGSRFLKIKVTNEETYESFNWKND